MKNGLLGRCLSASAPDGGTMPPARREDGRANNHGTPVRKCVPSCVLLAALLPQSPNVPPALREGGAEVHGDDPNATEFITP